MNWRAALAALRGWYANHSQRDRRIVLGVGVAVGVSLLFVGVVDPLRAYRRRVAEEIAEGQDRLERAARFAGAIDTLRAERDDLKKRLAQANGRLLPGDSGTLGAAALQERANTLAAEKNISVLSTQVMKEEQADPFRKVAVRLTLSGELKPFADFVSGLEYGPQQLAIPFLEVSRRGAVPGAKGPRTLSATVEVSGYLRAPGAGKDGAAPEAEPETPTVEANPAGGEGGAPAENAPGAATADAAGGAAPAAGAPPPTSSTPPGAPGPSPPSLPTVVTPSTAPGAVTPSMASPPPPPAAGAPPPAASGNAVGAGKPGADTPIAAPKVPGPPAPPPLVPSPPPAATPGAPPLPVPRPAAPSAAAEPGRP